jgi:hypothetical protein
MVYSSTLAVTQIIQRRKVGRLVNNEVVFEVLTAVLM